MVTKAATAEPVEVSPGVLDQALAQMQHRRGCPETRTVTDPDGSTNVISALEAYVVERGVTAGLANVPDNGGTVRGTPMSVIRCIACAEQVVLADDGLAAAAFREQAKKG